MEKKKERVRDLRVILLIQNDVNFACGVENLADRHSIGINGGYWVHQIPSQPNRGIFTSQTFFLIVDFLIYLTIWPISLTNSTIIL
jgi:hypothetical protein